MKTDWKHMTDAANDSADDSGFTICIVLVIIGIGITIIFADSIWAYLDWIMTVEENFRR